MIFNGKTLTAKMEFAHYDLTEQDYRDIVSYMELGVTNLALDTSDQLQDFYAIAGKLSSIPYNVQGVPNYVHTLEEIGVDVGDVITLAADLKASATELRLLVRALARTYDHNIYTTELASTRLRESAAGIKEAYDAGTCNWRYEAASSGYQFRLATDDGQTSNGNNSFQYGTQSLQYVSAASTDGNKCWIAIRIKSPAAGKHNISFIHGVNSNGANAGSVYIIPAAVIDEKLGDNAATYAQEMSDNPYQENGTTETFTKYRAAIEEAIAGEDPIMTPCYYRAEYGTTETTGEFTFEAETEYVAVFTADEKSPDHKSNAYILIGKLEAVQSEYAKQLDFPAAEFITSGRSAVTFQIPEGCGKLALYVENAGGSSTIVPQKYKCLKIERGNMPTGWIPAPADTIDAIVAQGTSGIWTWEKWASGKAICWASTVIENVDMTNVHAAAGLYGGVAPALMYPFSFAEIPLVFAAVNNADYEYAQIVAHTTGATGNIFFTSSSQQANASVPLKIYVVGKWK